MNTTDAIRQAPELKGSATHERLRRAFDVASRSAQRFLYLATMADIEGRSNAASLLRELAEAEAIHAQGHLDLIRGVGDPVTGLPIGETDQNLDALIASEIDEGETVYPNMARTARAEGFLDIADWFETMAKVKRGFAARVGELSAKGSGADPS